MHPLHFGNLWGTPFEVLWTLAGVVLALLAITGLLMYWNRFLRHRFRSTHSVCHRSSRTLPQPGVSPSPRLANRSGPEGLSIRVRRVSRRMP
jgi:hypothetical protein